MKGNIRVRVRMGFWDFKVLMNPNLLVTDSALVCIAIERLW